MDRAEARRVADRRSQQLADLRRTADHELAERQAVLGGETGANRMLDRPHAFPFCGRELQRVLTGRKARAGGVLQRRGHAVQHRQQPRVLGVVVDDAAVAIDDDVAERDRLGRRIVGADVDVDDDLHLAALGPLQ